MSYPGTLGWNFCHFGDPCLVILDHFPGNSLIPIFCPTNLPPPLQADSRRSGSGRHRNHGRSPAHPQPHAGQGHQMTPSQQQHHQMQQQQQQQQQHYGSSGKYPGHHQGYPQQQQSHGRRQQAPIAPTTGEMRSGHIEVDSLYGSGTAAGLTVNAMNAPNNSTVQCGCENIDCPFCNLMMSVQMSS